MEPSKTPPLLKTRTKDPMESSWRTHMGDGQWVPDVSVNACMLCRSEFSFWSRKHHCRRCGAVVCYACSGSRTKFIYKEISPDNMDDEEHRVCDLCIQVIDEKLAEGLNKRFGKNIPPSDNQVTHEQKEAETPLPPDRNANRAVLTTGRYRADIKESEGNRYIRDNDL
uniref:FYVE-type domain-containing protein n=1 Tax=Globisporangium ultimum (strain ATCC 200006 / CBS 805.95 / DAOM BR144) TaxID=431595 RepID=K3WUK0_GLOUD